MIHEFTPENIDAIGKVLGCTPKPLGDDVFRFEVVNDDENRKIALEIHLGLEIKGDKMNIVSVYASDTFIQLHSCTAFVASEILKQVTFFGKSGGMTSGLIVEETAGCSLYANVHEAVLSGDFTQLPEDLMMSGIALSLTESLDLGDFSFGDDE